MSGKAPDRRLAKTRSALAQALFMQMQRQPWDDISIASLCAEANVARSSFYAHFATKIELLDHVISRQMPNGAETASTDGRGPARLIEWLLDHATQNRALFQRVAVSSDAQAVMARFRRALADRLRADLAAQGIPVTDTVVAFILGGVFEALLDWARSWQIGKLEVLKSDVLRFADATLAVAAEVRWDRS